MSEKMRTIIEVGCGSGPFFLSSSPNARRLAANEQYVGADVEQDPLTKKRMVENPEQSALVQADGCRLPFASRSVDEVIFSNVLGSNQTEPFRKQLLQEAERVVNETGTITVVETYSPFIHPLRNLRSLARRAHLKQTNRGQEHDPSAIELYTPDSRRPTRYIATFTPRRTRSLKALLRR